VAPYVFTSIAIARCGVVEVAKLARSGWIALNVERYPPFN